MTEIEANGKTYKLHFTMLSVVRAKEITGKGFFELAQERTVGRDVSPEDAFAIALDLLLLGLQLHHGDEFHSVEDVAGAFDDIGCVQAVNRELRRFLRVDKSLQQRVKQQPATKKKTRGRTSPKTPTRRNAASNSASQPTKPSASPSTNTST